LCGDIVVDINVWDLIERDVLVLPRIWFVDVNEPELPSDLHWQTAYVAGVVDNEYRNNKILQIAKTFRDESKPTLILVTRVRHGHHLADLLWQHKVRAEFLYGDCDQVFRDSTLSRLWHGRLDAVVGITSLFSEGVDLPPLKAIINATGTRGGGNKEDGDTGRQTIQILGRGLRAYPGKTHLDYVDLADKTHPSLTGAAAARVGTLESEGYAPFVKFWHEYESEVV